MRTIFWIHKWEQSKQYLQYMNESEWMNGKLTHDWLAPGFQDVRLDLRVQWLNPKQQYIVKCSRGSRIKSLGFTCKDSVTISALQQGTSLVVTKNLWLILLSKVWLFSNLAEPATKNFYYSKDSKSVFIFSLALVVIELLAILWFLTK